MSIFVPKFIITEPGLLELLEHYLSMQSVFVFLDTVGDFTF